jgi:hypothetical protein
VGPVTDLYRLDSVEKPDFGRDTVWTTDPESAEWLARWQAVAADLPASRIYQAEVVIGDDECSFEVSDAVPGGSRDAKGLVASAARTAAREGYRWVQFRDGGRPWYEAILYLGDEPVPARPAQSIG